MDLKGNFNSNSNQKAKFNLKVNELVVFENVAKNAWTNIVL